MANRVPHIQVTVVDLDQDKINAWKSPILPVHEPDLLQITINARDGEHGRRKPNLFFSTDTDFAIEAADLIFLSVDTSTRQNGEGAGRELDLSCLEHATRNIARCAKKDMIVVVKSTVPTGTADALSKILASSKPGVEFEVLSNPEFLAQGTAIVNLLIPDRVLIGYDESTSGRLALSRLRGIYEYWIPRDRIIAMSRRSCELSKLAANALLAQRVSSINALSAMCEQLDANIEEVSKACGLDHRIGPHMLQASVGFGGSCFEKDIKSLSHTAETLDLHKVAEYWQSIVVINDWQKERLTQKIIQRFQGDLRHKKIAALGFAYKGKTGDTRHSPAIGFVHILLNEGAYIAVYDPEADIEHIQEAMSIDSGHYGRFMACDSPYDACKNAHAALVLTDWDMFSNRKTRSAITARDRELVCSQLKHDDAGSCLTFETNLNCSHGSLSKKSILMMGRAEVESYGTNYLETFEWSHVAKIMHEPKYIFDGRRATDKDTLEALGFQVDLVGS